MGFVPQEDILHESMTVYENLLFSALLRLPTRSQLASGSSGAGGTDGSALAGAGASAGSSISPTGSSNVGGQGKEAGAAAAPSAEAPHDKKQASWTFTLHDGCGIDLLGWGGSTSTCRLWKHQMLRLGCCFCMHSGRGRCPECPHVWLMPSRDPAPPIRCQSCGCPWSVVCGA